jgi:hypothetical protein
MADWNPSKDPYYASLYDKTPFDFIDTYRDTEKYLQERDSRESINSLRDLQIQDAQDQLETKTSLSEALKQGGDYRQAARQIYVERGDVKSLAELDKEIVDEEYRKIQMDKQQIENILALPPELGIEKYNEYFGKDGKQVTSLTDLYRANSKIGGSVPGGLYRYDPSGNVDVLTQGVHPPGWGQDKEDNVNLIEVMDNVTGESSWVPPRNAAALQGKSKYNPVIAEDIKKKYGKANAPEPVKEPTWWDKVQKLGEDTKRSQSQVPTDSKLNSAYKSSPAYNNQKIKEQGTKDVVVTLRKKQTQGMAQ